ncbi:MAG: PAS domain S-box protein, partial [Anaerolineaceae bacterium]
MKILIAEDDPVSALVLRRTLEREGHDVTLVVDGLAAWERFVQERPQLLISDWMMPGIDGPELCRRIRAAANRGGAYTYFIMVTAKAQDSDRNAAIAAGVDDFLAKPLNRLELNARIRVAGRILAWDERVRRTSDALAESEVRYRETFESLHDVYYQADPTGTFALVSPSALRHTGYTPEELVGQPVAALFPNGSDFAGLVEQIRTGRVVNDYEAQLQRKNGSHVTVSLNVESLRDGAGQITGYQGTMRDIQARKDAEEERDSIFRVSVDMVCVLGPDFTIQAANPAWQATLGYTPDRLTGRPFSELV